MPERAVESMVIVGDPEFTKCAVMLMHFYPRGDIRSTLTLDSSADNNAGIHFNTARR